MGECRVWLSPKDNPHMGEAEIRAQNQRLDRLLNSDTQDKINAQWDREQGPRRPGQVKP